MEHISGQLANVEKTLIIESRDARLQGSFTQIPDIVLRNSELSFGAKVIYGLLLSYAWHNNQVFPGQETLAKHAGTGRKTVNKYIQELVKHELVSVRRRGLGKTAIYTLHEIVRKRNAG